MIFGQRKKKALANKLYKTNCYPTKSCGLLRKVTFSQPSDFITQSKDIENLAKVCNRFNNLKSSGCADFYETDFYETVTIKTRIR